MQFWKILSLLVLIILLISSTSINAESTSCEVPGTFSISDELRDVFTSAEQIECINTRQIYHCSEMEKSLPIESRQKIIQCNKKSLENNKITDINLASCVWNGIKISGQNLLELAKIPSVVAEASLKGFLETKDCNTNILKKRELLNTYNISLSDSKFKLEEKFIGSKFVDMPCSEIETLLHARYDNYQQQVFLKIRNAKNTGKNYQIPQELLAKNSDLLKNLDQIFQEAKITYNCFTPKEKTELMCTALSTFLTDIATGASVGKAVLSLRNITKINSTATQVGKNISGGFGLSLNGATESSFSKLAKTTEQLQKIEVPYELHNYYGQDVIKAVPASTKNIPDWLKMTKALDEKHGIPTYIDPVILKQYGFGGASHRVPTKGTSILLDSDFITSDPQNVKFLMAHEAVHATGEKRILLGTVGPDNDLKMHFKSSMSAINSKLPQAYSRMFTIEEVKAYYKQGKMLETYLKNNGAKLDPLIKKQFETTLREIKMLTKDMSLASEEILNQTTKFLKENPNIDKQYITIIQRSGNESNQIFDIKISIPRIGKDNLEFNIPIRDVEAVQSGQIKDLNQRILTILEEAKKTVKYYQEGVQ